MSEHEILYVTPFRRRARKMERQIQAALDEGRAPDLVTPPAWVQGVRVERAGLLSWAVVGTANRGH